MLNFKLAFAVLALALTAACSTLQGAPSVLDDGQSPRRTTVAAIDTTISVFDKLTFAAAAGALPDNFLDDVEQFAPDAENIAAGYLDATAACVVIDGALQTDPATGKVCERSAVKRAFGDLSALVAEAVQRAGPGTDTGRAILVASLLLDRQLRPSSGDVITGYEKRDDLTLEEFNAARAALHAAFDRFVDTSRQALAAQTAK
jgi:hypothetical protein